TPHAQNDCLGLVRSNPHEFMALLHIPKMSPKDGLRIDGHFFVEPEDLLSPTQKFSGLQGAAVIFRIRDEEEVLDERAWIASNGGLGHLFAFLSFLGRCFCSLSPATRSRVSCSMRTLRANIARSFFKNSSCLEGASVVCLVTVDSQLPPPSVTSTC